VRRRLQASRTERLSFDPTNAKVSPFSDTITARRSSSYNLPISQSVTIDLRASGTSPRNFGGGPFLRSGRQFSSRSGQNDFYWLQLTKAVALPPRPGEPHPHARDCLQSGRTIFWKFSRRGSSRILPLCRWWQKQRLEVN
jgi:hypothetical protein